MLQKIFCVWKLIKFTKTSASRKTHFSYCVKFQQCNFVNVIPSSGRFNTARLAASCESSTLTGCTKSYTSRNLEIIASDTPGVTRTASWWAVDTRRREWATTNAPREYESFVAKVTQANSEEEKFEMVKKWFSLPRKIDDEKKNCYQFVGDINLRNLLSMCWTDSNFWKYFLLSNDEEKQNCCFHHVVRRRFLREIEIFIIKFSSFKKEIF